MPRNRYLKPPSHEFHTLISRVLAKGELRLRVPTHHEALAIRRELHAMRMHMREYKIPEVLAADAVEFAVVVDSEVPSAHLPLRDRPSLLICRPRNSSLKNLLSSNNITSSGMDLLPEVLGAHPASPQEDHDNEIDEKMAKALKDSGYGS
jgi:hypothetical protein